jgi:vacuolar-type H+-ATPase subunit C/Vma6
MVDPSLLIAGGGAAAVAVITGFAYWRVRPVQPFLYANARIQARTNYLISDSQFKTLAESKSLSQVISQLQNTDYYEALSRVNSLREYNLAIEKSFVQAVSELKEVSPKKLNELFDCYLMFYEAKMIKTIYRDKYSKVQAIVEPESKELVFEVGSLDSVLLKHLLEAETIADLKVVLSQTVYAPVFEKDYENLEEFEVALDSFVLDYFAKKVEKSKMFDIKSIVAILNNKFDIWNVLTLIKALVRKENKDKKLKLLTKTKSPLSALFERLADAPNIEEIVKLTEGLPVHAALVKALDAYKKDKSLAHFERELYHYYKTFVTESELSHIQGPYPLFAFLTKKEMEVQNLLIIAKGVEAKFSSKDIMEMII